MTNILGQEREKKRHDTLYVLNASPLSVFPRHRHILAHWQPMTVNSAICEIVGHQLEGGAVVSAIGHEDTARVVSTLLKTELAANRISVELQEGNKMIVAQLSGERLPPGATTLPDGAIIDFYLLQNWKALTDDEFAENSAEIVAAML